MKILSRCLIILPFVLFGLGCCLQYHFENKLRFICEDYVAKKSRLLENKIIEWNEKNSDIKRVKFLPGNRAAWVEIIFIDIDFDEES